MLYLKFLRLRIVHLFSLQNRCFLLVADLPFNNIKLIFGKQKNIFNLNFKL